MGSLSSIAPRYIESNKYSLLDKYYNRHTEGAVILFFNSDGSLYKEQFMTKTEIMNSYILPVNAYEEANEYWSKFPNQLVFMSWFYPVEPYVRFNVYALGSSQWVLVKVTPNQGVQGEQVASESDCFVVTATFDTPDAIFVVDRYRSFRDRYLLKNFLGIGLVRSYYLIGPHLANLVKTNLLLKSISKKLLLFILVFLPDLD
jgi:hypothetical protein